jgi:hypothetical protein
MYRWRQYVNASASVRIGILLVVLWLLCRWGTEHANDSIAKQFANFWWNIGMRFDPTHRDPSGYIDGIAYNGGQDGWFVIPIAGSMLFALPMFIKWAASPIVSKMRFRR